MKTKFMIIFLLLTVILTGCASTNSFSYNDVLFVPNDDNTLSAYSFSWDGEYDSDEINNIYIDSNIGDKNVKKIGGDYLNSNYSFYVNLTRYLEKERVVNATYKPIHYDEEVVIDFKIMNEDIDIINVRDETIYGYKDGKVVKYTARIL